MVDQYLVVGLVLAMASIICIYKNKLTPSAGVAGWVMGLIIFAGAGYAGLAMLSLFFALGTIATTFGKTSKMLLGLSSSGESCRRMSQVIANGGVGALLALLMLLLPGNHKPLLLTMLAASLSSATAATLSSELGNVYGSRYFNIISYKKDTRGLDGVISLEGTLFGIAGSIFIALGYALFMNNFSGFFIIVFAGTMGNVADSVLGATVEKRRYLDNDAVNFINTSVGALVACLLY